MSIGYNLQWLALYLGECGFKSALIHDTLWTLRMLDQVPDSDRAHVV